MLRPSRVDHAKQTGRAHLQPKANRVQLRAEGLNENAVGAQGAIREGREARGLGRDGAQQRGEQPLSPR